MTPICQLNGLIVDGLNRQLASGSHAGLPGVMAGENPNIDNPCEYNGNTGMTYTDFPINVVSNDGAGNVILNFSGFGITWNDISYIPLKRDIFFGTSCLATMKCALDCSDGDTYVLDYFARFPHYKPQNNKPQTGQVYQLHLEGTVSGDLPAPVPVVVAPVPAAFWLFSSGFIGLAGVAKRRHSCLNFT